MKSQEKGTELIQVARCSPPEAVLMCGMTENTSKLSACGDGASDQTEKGSKGLFCKSALRKCR